MIKFNPENKATLTYGEALGPAMEITDSQEATQYLNDYISYLEQFKDEMGNNTSEQIAKINLGYFAGYYSNEVRQRVQKLFCASHPIFGDAIPTTEEAMECGKQGLTLNELRNNK